MYDNNIIRLANKNSKNICFSNISTYNSFINSDFIISTDNQEFSKSIINNSSISLSGLINTNSIINESSNKENNLSNLNTFINFTFTSLINNTTSTIPYLNNNSSKIPSSSLPIFNSLIEKQTQSIIRNPIQNSTIMNIYSSHLIPSTRNSLIISNSSNNYSFIPVNYSLIKTSSINNSNSTGNYSFIPINDSLVKTSSINNLNSTGNYSLSTFSSNILINSSNIIIVNSSNMILNSTILETDENSSSPSFNPETTSINIPSNVETTIPSQPSNSSKEITTTISITLIGIDSYQQTNDLVSFFIYFKTFLDTYLQNITITINIIYQNRIRALQSTDRKIICKIQNDQIESLLKYNCLFNSDEAISKISLSEEINFGENYKLVIPSSLKHSMDNIQDQKEDKFSSKEVLVLENSILTQDDNNFSIIGILDGKSFYSDKIILNIYHIQTKETKAIQCFTKEENAKRY